MVTWPSIYLPDCAFWGEKTESNVPTISLVLNTLTLQRPCHKGMKRKHQKNSRLWMCRKKNEHLNPQSATSFPNIFSWNSTETVGRLLPSQSSIVISSISGPPHCSTKRKRFACCMHLPWDHCTSSGPTEAPRRPVAEASKGHPQYSRLRLFSKSTFDWSQHKGNGVIRVSTQKLVVFFRRADGIWRSDAEWCIFPSANIMQNHVVQSKILHFFAEVWGSHVPWSEGPSSYSTCPRIAPDVHSCYQLLLQNLGMDLRISCDFLLWMEEIRITSW